MSSYPIVYKFPISPQTTFEKSWNPTEIIWKNFIHYLCVPFFWKDQFVSDSQRGMVYMCMCCVLSCSVMSNSLQPHGLQPARLLYPWEFSGQEYWRGLPCPPPGDLPNPGIEPRFPLLQVDSLPSEPPGKPMVILRGPLFSLPQGLTSVSLW